MRLTPHEQERLLLSYAAELARRRKGRGLKLNHPEAVAIITDHVLEGRARRPHGRRTHGLGARGAAPRRCPRGRVGDAARRAEATFPDDTKLVTVHHPIG